MFLGLYSMLESRIPTASVGGVIEQAIGNGVAGLIVFELNRAVPRWRWSGVGSGHVKRRLEW